MDQKLSPEVYFDLIHEAELRHIIRQLSARPRSADWKSQVNLRDVLNVVQIGGPLAACARSEFLDLRTLCSAQGNSLKSALYADVLRPSGRDLFERLLRELSPTLQRLHICYLVRGVEFNISTLLPKCLSIRYLQISDESDKFNFPALLHACSGNLVKLSITGTSLTEDRINTIAQHCIGLKKLEIQYQRVDGALSEIWKAIGPTLTHLAIFKDAIICGKSLDRIDEIAERCVKV